MAPATYMDVADAIRRDVEAGRWPIGDPIPGIDRLKDEYGVSRQTANRAVQHLVASGLLYSEGRRGTFIRPRLDRRPLSATASPTGTRSAISSTATPRTGAVSAPAPRSWASHRMRSPTSSRSPAVSTS